MVHIPEDLIEEYALGRLQEPALALLEEHLLICEDCRERLQITDEFVLALRDTALMAQAAG